MAVLLTGGRITDILRPNGIEVNTGGSVNTEIVNIYNESNIISINAPSIGSSYAINLPANPPPSGISNLQHNSGTYSWAPLPGSTYTDDTFTVRNATDTSKTLAIDCSTISTGQTRTLSIPDESGKINIDTPRRDRLFIGWGHIAPPGTDAGSVVTGAWTTYPLSMNAGSATGEGSSGIVLNYALSHLENVPQGNYLIHGLGTFYRTGHTNFRVWNVTDNQPAAFGLTAYADPASGSSVMCQLLGIMSLNAISTIRLEYFAQFDSGDGDSLGKSGGIDDGGFILIYGGISLEKI
jgi:hypothetical protein